MGLTEAHRRRIAASRFEAQRERDLRGQPSTLRRARLTAEGGRGMSQQALAVLAGCSRDAVSRAERRDPAVSTATLRRLCAVLDVPLGDARQ